MPQDHSGDRITFKGLVIGRDIDPVLQASPFTDEIQVKTYIDFISGVRGFYQEYRRIVESEDYAL